MRDNPGVTYFLCRDRHLARLTAIGTPLALSLSGTGRDAGP
jgi:hypothetical protein